MLLLSLLPFFFLFLSSHSSLLFFHSSVSFSFTSISFSLTPPPSLILFSAIRPIIFFPSSSCPLLSHTYFIPVSPSFFSVPLTLYLPPPLPPSTFSILRQVLHPFLIGRKMILASPSLPAAHLHVIVFDLRGRGGGGG